MNRLSQLRALIGDCTEAELLAVLNGVLNAEWCTYSDQFADAFHDTFNAFDRDCANYTAVECRTVSRKAA